MNRAWSRPASCSGGGCIEVSATGGRVEIRDSKRWAEITWCTPTDFAAFVAAVKDGEFDHITKGATT